MAHIPPSAAIFSPSIARLASSATKDWNYVDSWLAAKFPSRSPPPFERNPETLRVLVALAASNETADEDRALVLGVEASALQTLTQAAAAAAIDDNHASSNGGLSPTVAAESITAAIEGDLSREGRSAFDSLATTSVDLGVAYPTPALLGHKITELQALQQLEEEENVHLELLAYVKALDEQINYFQDLPPDKDLARQQLEALRAELHNATQKRDLVFEGLVERATPKRLR
ncbi:hypothetical protein SCUCBS95973_000325 [Sporothrix curviconia]|uniref:Kinetochore protein n=1 Tax=Sporothrix curviconia TaxID=1260050 RepID=A0ABP0AP84_9PEZI